MNLVLLETEELLPGGDVVLDGRRAAHVLTVHRAEPGRVLRVGVLGGSLGHAEVTAIERDRVRLRILDLASPPPAPLPLSLVLALPRPKVVNRTFAAIASMGIKHVEIINAWRVEKSYWKTPRIEPARIRAQLLLGLEQAGDTILPQIAFHRFFRNWVDQTLPGHVQRSRVLVAHPGAPPLAAVRGDDVVLIVGPEGGFIEDEMRLLAERGVTAFSAGTRILRVETAVPWLAGRLVP